MFPAMFGPAVSATPCCLLAHILRYTKLSCLFAIFIIFMVHVVPPLVLPPSSPLTRRKQGPDAAPQGSMSLNVVEARKAQTEELLGQLGGRAQLPAQAVRRITRTVGYVIFEVFLIVSCRFVFGGWS